MPAIKSHIVKLLKIKNKGILFSVNSVWITASKKLFFLAFFFCVLTDETIPFLIIIIIIYKKQRGTHFWLKERSSQGFIIEIKWRTL